MGGRGASSGGRAGGGGSVQVKGTQSLVSEREEKRAEVDQTLSVTREIERKYGVDVNAEDLQVVTLGGLDAATVMAYYDSSGNLAVNKNYFDSGKIDTAYDNAVASGFHPGRGSKTGLEAVVAHEMGHRLTDVAGQKAGKGNWAVDSTASEIVRKAAKAAGYKSTKAFRESISGYGGKNAAEAVAEAFADVFCNGSKAKRESQAIVTELDKYF